MECTLDRELRLSTDEVAEAVSYWLVIRHDVQVGEKPLVEFRPGDIVCHISSKEEAVITQRGA